MFSISTINCDILRRAVNCSDVSKTFVVYMYVKHVHATLLNPDMCNPDFRLNRTDWKVPGSSYTYNSYTHNPDFV